MRILMLTQYYAPEPHDKFTSLAKGLTQRGHEVQVLTGFPCYPLGKTYAGWRQRVYQEETIDGVHVVRLPQFPDHSLSVWRRAAYYLSFALSAATLGVWRSKQADVVLVYQAALPVGLAALVLSRFRRAPLVLDVVDLWPESVAATGMLSNPLLLGVIRRVAQAIYGQARHICVITQGYREKLLALGIPKAKLSVIHMWGQGDTATQPGEGDDSPRQTHDQFVCLYTGAMGPCQSLDTVLDAAALLTGDRRIQFIMVGDGVCSSQLHQKSIDLELSNVEFVGRLPRQELPQWIRRADALLLTLKTDPMSVVSIPSKTIAYLAAGKPVLAAIDGETAEIVKQYRCGIATPAQDPKALARAIIELASNPENSAELGASARRAYEQLFDPDRQIDRFEATLLEAVRGQKTTSMVPMSRAA